MKNNFYMYIAISLVLITFCSCERDKNIDILINGESLNYEVRATYLVEKPEYVYLLITDRFFDGYEDFAINIINLKTEVGICEFASNPFSDDSLAVYTYRGFPEFGNQERPALLFVDDRYDSYFELVSFENGVGHCRIRCHAALPEDERDFEGYDPERYEFEIEGDFEFKIF